MQSLSLTLTQGVLKLQAALPAVAPNADPKPGPTIKFDGKVNPRMQTAGSNLLANILFCAAIVAAAFAIFNFIAFLRGKHGAGGKTVASVIAFLIFMAPASVMTWANDFWNTITG